jgi:hypothetical protein
MIPTNLNPLDYVKNAKLDMEVGGIPERMFI